MNKLLTTFIFVGGWLLRRLTCGCLLFCDSGGWQTAPFIRFREAEEEQPISKTKIGNLVLLLDHQVRGLLMPKVTIGSHFSISFALSSPPPAVRRHYLSVR